MREFVKVLCVVTVIVAGIGAALAWFDDKPSGLTWAFRVGLPTVCLAALAGFLAIHFQRDKVPDYLYARVRSYFDRGGFCFAATAAVENGICFFYVWFQNRYERPCVGRVALRPARGLFQTRKFDAITFEIHADAAAFGVATIPVPIPVSCQGQRQKFEVGASVDYPEGKGQMLRFRDGLALRSNANFGNNFRTALTVAGALGGGIVLYKPASMTVSLPSGAAEEVPEDRKPQVTTLWKLGDPPLQPMASQGAER